MKISSGLIYWIGLLSAALVSTRAAILGHSGVVLHVDKYGHLSGHSSHYDYRVYPDKYEIPHFTHHNSILDDEHVIEEHHVVDDDDEVHSHHEPYEVLDDHYHGSQPYYYYVPQKHHGYHH